MKSINIVYRHPKKSHRSSQIEPKIDIRRYVDEYFTKITNRNNQKEDESKSRSKTARITSKIIQNNQGFNSLSIAPIKTPNPILSPPKTLSERVIRKNGTFNIQKKKRSDSLFTLRLFQKTSQFSDIDSPTRSYFRPKDLLKHSKVNCLSKIKCQKQTTIIISADFITNQFAFWTEQPIQLGCVKGWKILAPLANIIWLVRKQSTCKKIQQFAQHHNLKVDGIIHLQPNKKQTLTISYNNFEQEAKLNNKQKLVIINSLRIKSQGDNNNNNEIQYFQFKHSLPIILHKPTLIHFVKIDISNDKNRFNNILKVVSSSSLPPKFNILPLIQDFRQIKQKTNNNQYLSEWNQEDQNVKKDVLAILETFKDNLHIEFQHSINLNTKIEGDSIYYITGDLIRRNYGIAKQFYKYCDQVQRRQRKYKSQLHLSSPEKYDSEIKRSFTSINFSPKKKSIKDYFEPIYIWDA